jgi:hypothetical protein
MSYLYGVPFDVAIAQGMLPGFTSWTLMGSASGASAVEQDIIPWANTPYVYPATAQRMAAVSSNAGDAATGNGARTIRIFYLDGSYNEQYVDVTLNGTTPVQTTVVNIFRVQDVRVTSVGINNKNIGNISITNTAGTVTYARLDIGTNQTRQAIWTVPAGKTLVLTQLDLGIGELGSGPKYIRFMLKANYDILRQVALPPGFFMIYWELTQISGSGLSTAFNPIISFPAQTDIKMAITTNENSAVATCVIKGWTQPDTL